MGETKIVRMSLWEEDSYREHMELQGWKVRGYDNYVGRPAKPTVVELRREATSTEAN